VRSKGRVERKISRAIGLTEPYNAAPRGERHNYCSLVSVTLFLCTSSNIGCHIEMKHFNRIKVSTPDIDGVFFAVARQRLFCLAVLLGFT
jgi:hypothetical protein